MRIKKWQGRGWIFASAMTILMMVDDGAQGFTLLSGRWGELGDEEVRITYSYNNLLDSSFAAGISIDGRRDATEAAFRLWASYAPLHFVEVPNTGPVVSDTGYLGRGLPNIRMGFHFIDGNPPGPDVKAHAWPPSTGEGCGLCGDVHFDTEFWMLTNDVLPQSNDPAFPFFAILTHEIGHSLGLGHTQLPGPNSSVMHPSIRFVLDNLVTADLFEDDIIGIQYIYGAGIGSVTPLPVPGTFSIVMIIACFVPLGRRKSRQAINGIRLG